NTKSLSPRRSSCVIVVSVSVPPQTAQGAFWRWRVVIIGSLLSLELFGLTRPRVLPPHGVKPVNGNDVEVAVGLIVRQRHVQRLARFDFGHHQAFWKGFVLRVLLNDLAVLEDGFCLLAADAALSGTLQRVIAPLNPAGCGGGLNCLQRETHDMETG